MHRFVVSSICLAAFAAAIVVAQAPAKIATFEDHAALMKANAQANGALGKALGSGAFADGRTQVTALRQNFRTLETFWTEKKNDTALKIVKEGLTRLDALDKMLQAPAPDQAAAQAAVKEFAGATCARATRNSAKAIPRAVSSSGPRGFCRLDGRRSTAPKEEGRRVSSTAALPRQSINDQQSTINKLQSAISVLRSRTVRRA